MADDLPGPGDRELELTVERAAEILGITPAHVLELTRNGVLSARDSAGARLISARDVEAFAERRRRQLAVAREIAARVNDSREGWDS